MSKTINDLLHEGWQTRHAQAVTDDAHARLWAEHREAIVRAWWAFRTSGYLDVIAILIDGAVTADGAPFAEVVRLADAPRVLSNIRADLLGGVPVETTFRNALRPDPLSRRLLVVSGTPGAGLDYVVQDDLVLTSRGGDA